MSKALRITAIAAGITLALGLTLWLIGGLLGGFSVQIKDRGQYEDCEESIRETVKSIDLQEISADVEILPAPDGVCRIAYRQTEREPLEIRVENGTLRVSRKVRKNRINLVWWPHSDAGAGETRLYLPEAAYEKLCALTVSGDIRLTEGITAGAMELTTTSGDITAQALRADALKLNSVSGKIELTEGIAADTLSCETVSGDIALAACDGGEIRLASVSGNISANLRETKRFSTETVSGSVDVPYGREDAGVCRAETVSGDIHITVS